MSRLFTFGGNTHDGVRKYMNGLRASGESQVRASIRKACKDRKVTL